MQQKIISGKVKLPEEQQQQKLHRQLQIFANWLQKPKNLNEIQKDKQKSVPIQQLPMVF